MLYRFRSTTNLLDRRELEDQYFYFASPPQQNDPMEGYLEFYWKGDWIAWIGLFKHYVWQVFMTLFSIPLKPSLDDLKKLHLSHTEIHWNGTKLPELRVRVETAFSQDRRIRSLAEALGASGKELSAAELQTILFSIHGPALYYASGILHAEGLPSLNDLDIKPSFFTAEPSDKHIDALIEALKEKKLFADIAKVEEDVLRSLSLSAHRNSLNVERPSDYKATALLFLEFPAVYAKRIEWLAFPDWYCVCFNTAISNPALWGYYADGHKGVCLIFKNEPKSGIFLSEQKANGSPERKYFPFHQVRYGEAPIRVDFFLSLGWLWGDERSHWLIHGEEKSQTLIKMFADEDKWRASFTRNNTNRYLMKSAAWAQEREYRIILDDLWENHSKTEHRRYHYDFSDLDGIVFGMRTPLEEKLRIIDIIDKKCREHKRESFHFYQAAFDTATSQIVAEPITLYQ